MGYYSFFKCMQKGFFAIQKLMFKDKTILITGAASGLGRAWAQGFSADGATVIAADISGEGLVEVPAALRITVDVSKAEDVERMIATTVKQTGRIDVLFNNAGLGFNKRLENSEQGDFEHHVAVHLFAMVNAMRAAIPHMRAQNFGRIINTISRNAEYDTVGTSAYAAAKAGMWAASRVAAAELSDKNILINMLIPGPTRTAIWGKDMAHFQEPSATYPTARMLASFAKGGPTGKVFWDEAEYPMFQEGN
jgi:NAD(P)-dependent dehydrogenase (short-subunit alcohol dehydrogenase family)